MLRQFGVNPPFDPTCLNAKHVHFFQAVGVVVWSYDYDVTELLVLLQSIEAHVMQLLRDKGKKTITIAMGFIWDEKSACRLAMNL